MHELDRYFGDDHGLVEAVVADRCAFVLGFHAHALGSVSDWEDLGRWADVIVAEQGVSGGCPLGTLAAELSDSDEALRTSLGDAFGAWREAIRGALARLRRTA
jgi:hypothetical protein